MSATVAVLWLLFPIEIRVVKAGARRVYFDFRNMFSVEIEPNGQQVQNEEFSMSKC